MLNFQQAIKNAAILIDDGQNEEYTRGICEFLEMCFPKEGEDTPTRVEDIKQSIISYNKGS